MSANHANRTTSSIIESFDYLNYESDPRTRIFPFINWPYFLTLFPSTVAYLIVTTQLIPRWMKNRQPYEIRRIIFCYNILMVAINSFYFVFFVKRTRFGLKFLEMSYPPVEYSQSTLDYILLLYIYGATKILDWFDTLFFTLRKKDNHLTFLHLYHHSMVPTLGWIYFKINPMMNGFLIFGVCNSFVHTVMYSYYALSSFGPSIQRFLWWKKYITQMQLLQFFIYGFYIAILGLFGSGYPTFCVSFIGLQPPFFFYMFYDFYLRSYRSKKLR